MCRKIGPKPGAAGNERPLADMAQEGQSRMKLQALRDEAAAWVVRLSDPSCSDAERVAFEAWRHQSPAHDATYEREAAAWERLDRLRALRPGLAEADPDLLAPQDPS